MSFSGSLNPTPFTVNIPDKDLDDLKTLIQLGRLPPTTFEGTQPKYGVTSAWMKEAKEYWLSSFNWRKHEERINQFPNYIVNIVDDDGRPFKVHFLAVLSSDPRAIPIVLMHGWPGSFLEFLDIIPTLAASKSPSFHVIVPSLPGYAFSTVPTDCEFGFLATGRIINKLMVGLGFGDGYIAQGGDIGSMVASVLGSRYSTCKAVHQNFSRVGINPPDEVKTLKITDQEREGLKRGEVFSEAYAQAHGQRPSTIGHVLASNPLALLAWIGEKFLSWTDKDPSLDAILESVTLYWLTETFPRSIYPYRNRPIITSDLYISRPKPVGYSWFPKEICPTPKSWMDLTGNIVFVRYHDQGGHFAAMEQPDLLAKDIIDFVEQVKEDVFHPKV